MFSAGDTLIFQRYLAGYLPSDGWHLHYVLTDGQGNEKTSFDSTQSTTDPTCHAINVPNFAAALDAGEYILSATVVNSAGNAALNIAAGQRHTVYYGELALDPDLADGLATLPVQTFAAKMLDILKTKLERLESYDMTELDMQRSKAVVEDKNKTWERYWRLVEFRNYELKNQTQRNTGQNQNSIGMAVGAGW